MKKIPNETQLLKKALVVGEAYAKNRGFKTFSASDASKHKVECIYRLLVNDKLITPLPAGGEDLLSMKQKLAVWLRNKLPKDHELLK
jgi:hypothetical protein